VKKSEEKRKAAIEKKEVSRVNLQSFIEGRKTQRRGRRDRACRSAGGWYTEGSRRAGQKLSFDKRAAPAIKSKRRE